MVRWSEVVNEIKAPSFKGGAFQRLQNAGYTMLGKEGSKGAVFKKPGANYIVKVFDSTDKAFLTFVKLAQANPNPHFPHYYGKIVNFENYYAIRTEELTDCEGFDVIDNIATYINGHGKSRTEYIFFPWDDYDKAVKWIESQPALKKACDLLIAHVGRFSFDLKVNNVMMRGQTPVFIDPYK